MGSNLNFMDFTNDPSSDSGGRPPGNFQLARQPSIYSLTFDEFQSTMGALGKDFGSMNMDELLRNIWSAEENQQQTTAAGCSGVVQEGLQRQGSLTLPRTLSQKTVDEVWKDILKEYGAGSGTGGVNVPQRQQTLGEMPLEEFLARVGVVREDTQLAGKVDGNGAFLGHLSRSVNNSGLGIGFQPNGGVVLSNTAGNHMSMQSSNLPLDVNGIKSNQAQAQVQAQQQQRRPIYPKQPNVGYMSQWPLQSSPGIRDGIMGIGDQGIGGGLMQGGGMGMVGLGGVAAGSPVSQLSSDGIVKSNGDTSSVSPTPYVFNGGLRGRRTGGAVEKAAERRQRRMIKNRESAARSRARKQAYTMELEEEVGKLKEENQVLQKKQEEIMEIQQNQVMEMINMKQGGKRRCLRRTQTDPW